MNRFLPTLRRTSAKVIPLDRTMEQKAVLSEYYNALHRFESGIRARRWPIERAVAEGYERVIWVFKPVNTIAADHARLPYRIKQDGQPLTDHPLYRVLNKRANPMETGKDFRKRLSAQISLSKQGAFVLKGKSYGGTVKRLDLLPPDRVQMIPGEPGSDVLVSHYEFTRRTGGIQEYGPDEIIWFRDPHPLDPYSGVTPLEAAGMSVELDYFARLYNVSFMRNDGRPGGVLAVRNNDGTSSDIEDKHMDRLEDTFSGRGPVDAGKISVVSGELSYVDLAVRPRDMQYTQTSKNSKIELLAAYGVPESVLGYSAERTYDNADAELYTYWTITMPKHNDIIVSGFDEDSDDDLEGYLDTSEIEVLERAKRAEREEARKEVEAGLRSIKSYANKAGYGDEIDDTPHTRALYITNGRTPIPSREEDAKALGLEQPTEAPPAEQEIEPAADPAAQPAQPAQMVAAPGPAEIEGPPPSAVAATPDRGQVPASLPPGYAPAAAIGAGPGQIAAKQLPAGARPIMLVKRAAPTFSEVTYESDVDERLRDRLEDMLTAGLTALSTRWLKRASVRMASPKTRKGTRHWQADRPTDTRGGTKALDSAKAVDEETWVSEAETGTRPMVAEVAVVAAAALLADLEADDDGGLAPSAIVSDLVDTVVRLIADSAGRQAMRLVQLINEADQDGEARPDMAALEALVEAQAPKLASWAAGVATQAATATVNGARDAAAEEVAETRGDDVTRTWLSRRDEKVRHSHEEADGQQQPLGRPFEVGDSLLRFPCDPLAPVHETARCRCRLLHRSKRSGRFVSAPLATAV